MMASTVFIFDKTQPAQKVSIQQSDGPVENVERNERVVVATSANALSSIT
jgi:hypothetical protein